MKVLFVGPTLNGQIPELPDISVRPPARQGDIANAVLEGATAIGLVDGYFDAVAAPWHKEILFALASGVTMLGSSSMGALRAAECASFGMRPIGAIAMAYSSGVLDDDAAVALSHGPAELGYPPLTEPLVNVGPSLERLRELGLITEAARNSLWLRAGRLNFRDRTDEAMFAEADDPAALAAYRKHRVDRKADDALLLIAELEQCPDELVPRPDLSLPSTLFTRQVLPALARVESGT